MHDIQRIIKTKTDYRSFNPKDMEGFYSEGQSRFAPEKVKKQQQNELSDWDANSDEEDNIANPIYKGK